ncbi:LysR family transcriptional regulator [Bradyrhizobium sp. Arg237L]|uniref:LysR family transcriptional regulator n=1 Tax=Bradyrhizobium sp. Arg237L TaxID=3003352 RepID=UPI00249D97A6|nr:LysR family transcriptional regulator [Bradyrhizobium sp. Arg237L]MDI4237351.1 LysR family transcriptional regulator [Bradyrhizobium sp. Arg237L]
MDRLDAMSTLLAVVETGSFSGASRKMRVPVTTVSRRVAELEAHLRTKLLQRTTRKVKLTDAGAPYVVACRKVLEQISEAERNAAGEYQSPRGELTVTAPLVFGRMHLVPIIAEFMTQFVDVRLNCRFHDRNLDLQDEGIDVAVRVGPLSDSRWRARRVCTVQRVVCASPHYLARRGEPLTLADINTHDCVSFHGLDPPGSWLFPTSEGTASVPIRSRIMFDTIESAIDAGIAGIGLIRVLSYHVRPAIRSGLLREVLAEFAPPEAPVQIIHRHDELVPLKVRAFIDFSVPRLETLLAL